MRKNKNLPLLEKIEITGIAAEGKSIARYNNKVLFVPSVVPGDIVDVQLTRKRKNFLEGVAVHFHKISEGRAEPFCSHFGICGGCKWQNLPYAKQLDFKQQQVIDAFERIGKIEMPVVSPIIGSLYTQNYRNKLEFTFSSRRWLTREEINSDVKEMCGIGFHIPGRFDKVLDIERCYLQQEPSNAIRLFIKEYALKNNLQFFDLRKQNGFLRTLIIRTSLTDELMVIVVFFYEDEESRIKLLNAIKTRFQEITSLYFVINSKANDTLGDREFFLYHGKDHILEKMEDLLFKVGPKSFYQTNSVQAYELYKKTSEFAGLDSSKIVYDLYTGIGTIANFVARKAKKVIGIEYVSEAIGDAEFNSKLNGINNTRFFAGDIKDILSREFAIEHGLPDVIIIDPPRTGMHKVVIDHICTILPARIVYVSCNPATQSRDIQLMNDFYKVTGVQPVDMFPHTHHVENIALLERRE